MPNRKVLHIIGSLDRGCETHLLNIVPGLMSFGFDVHIFALSHEGELAPEFKARGIKVIKPWATRKNRASNIFMRGIKLFFTLSQLFYVLLSLRPSLVHFFLPASYWFAGTLSTFFTDVKKVMSRRSLNLYMNNQPLIKKLELFLHKRMDAILGNSKAVVKELIEEGCEKSKVSLIYNGLDIQKPSKSKKYMRNQLGISNRAIVMTTVANLIPYKGHSDLLVALSKLKVEDEWVLLCVGRDDGIGMRLKKEAKRYGIQNKVKFLGVRSDITDIYNLSDIALLVSHQEGFSNAILEAMSMSLPLIVTDVGGNAEAVENNITGYVVEKQNIDALTHSLAKLISLKGQRTKMGLAGKKRLLEKFSLDSCVANYISVYKDL